ncbi:hypothetical protein IWQ60_005356 [Tieghemiomyces parasiticus]|uniref:Needs CLA4 to survive protein 3 n=1 Tax=Tieghemiomyces parasiticus TaxID=78921 RepID=A0A9W8DYA7_9FUNG|nr:hypothetical protein IWQ60_005356 [Tieghemiomyces parasiticus]
MVDHGTPEGLTAENRRLVNEVAQLRAELSALRAEALTSSVGSATDPTPVTNLTNPEIARYSQLKLRNAAVVVIGAGGLGSPCLLYLAAMGVGRLGVVDHDRVEVSNLQRQVIHTERAGELGMSKAQSARDAVARLNAACRCTAHEIHLNSDNALELLSAYDVVVDATDNAATRYLINDACVLLDRPLVSASALRLEGQLTVYHHRGGPCYRCLFPEPPPPAAVTNCSEGGVLGVVPGVLGTLQALEVVKVLLDVAPDAPPVLMLFSAFRQPTFRAIRLRGRQPRCAVCGPDATITHLLDYPTLCGQAQHDGPSTLALLPANQRVTCSSYATAARARVPHLLLDVREPVQFAICHLPGAVNVAWSELPGRIDEIPKADPIYVVCRFGNDSQEAVQYLRQAGYSTVRDLIGGLHAWSASVDPDFPVY